MSNISKKFAALVALSAGAVGSAMAELPAAVNTTIAGIKTDGQSLFDGVFPVIGVFVGLVVVVKLFKRFVSKI